MSAADTEVRVLLTGATGFLGGTVLASLLSSPSRTPITCLVRGPAAAAKLSSAYGPRVAPVVYGGADDLQPAEDAAAGHDVVVNAGIGYHAGAALALLRGLARRRASLRASGIERKVWMLHTSGTSNLADLRISRAWVDPAFPDGRIFDDERDDIYAYERMREDERAYIQRAAELAVVDAGLELGVEVVVLMPPTIFGLGTGLFKTTSIQIPAMIGGALRHGRSVVLGDGRGVNGRVHVLDLAELYRIVVAEMTERNGERLPRGKRAILFAGSGEFSWLEAAQGVADACFEAGKIANREVESVGLAEGTRIWSTYLPEVTEEVVETGLSGNSRTVASVARRLGWAPTRGEEEWKKGFVDDLRVLLDGRK